MTPELIQGKRKREEAEVRSEEEEEESTERQEDDRVPDPEPVYDVEQLPIQEQPLKLVRKNTPPTTSDLGKSFFWNYTSYYVLLWVYKHKRLYYINFRRTVIIIIPRASTSTLRHQVQLAPGVQRLSRPGDH